MRAFVQAAKFEWVRHEQKHIDISVAPLSQVLESLSLPREDGTRSSMSIAEMEDIVKPIIQAKNKRRFQSRKDYWDAEDVFTGNVHCESLIMSYTDLKNNRNNVSLPAEEMENRQNIFACLPESSRIIFPILWNTFQ